MVHSLNDAAPMSSPIARPNESLFSAAKVEKTSGLPFPNARKVTPAVDSLRPRYEAMVDKLGQKKSEAEIPMKEKRKARRTRIPRATNGRRKGGAERYQSSYGREKRDWTDWTRVSANLAELRGR